MKYATSRLRPGWTQMAAASHACAYSAFFREILMRLCIVPILAITAVLAGCEKPAAKGVTEIVYWTGWSGHEFEVQQRLINEFNRTHPHIHVHMLSQFGNSGYQKVRIAFAGGATPDVMSTVWADELAGYAMRGVLTPLDHYLLKSGRDVNREFAPGVAKMLQIEGHVYGLAVTTNTNFIAYNKAIFADAGLDPNNPPRTIAELDAAARACTKYDAHGNFIRYGFRPGGLNLWAYVFGGGWYDTRSKRITANDPHNVAALEWMASYRKKYDIQRMEAFQTTFGSDETPSGPFFVGKVAMWSTGEWAKEFIRRYAPKLNWGWFALPAPPGGRTDCTTAGGSVFVIPAACKHKVEAWEFLNWISSPHAVKEFCLGIGNVPPLLEVGRDPAFQRDPLFRFAIAIAQGANSFGPPPIPIWPTYSREITRVEQAAMLGGKDPKRLLDDLQTRMSLELKRTLADLGR
ncbi:MAG: ABC transporter substrate-binding protein [Chthonomonadales bacterium]